MYQASYLCADGKELEIGKEKDRKKLNKRIMTYVKQKGYTSPYWRYWIEPNGIEVIDFGSWSEFVHVKTILD